MPAPRFQILQVVRIADHSDLASHGLAGQVGCITQIREYPGSVFRYSVRGLDPADDDDDGVSSLYAEQHLEPAGQTAPAELFALPGFPRGRDRLRCRRLRRARGRRAHRPGRRHLHARGRARDLAR
jgi:hypothetical protein